MIELLAPFIVIAVGVVLVVVLRIVRVKRDADVKRDHDAQLLKALGLHRKPDAVQHEPSGLLGHAKRAPQLVRANAVLAIGQHPKRQVDPVAVSVNMALLIFGPLGWRTSVWLSAHKRVMKRWQAHSKAARAIILRDAH